VPSTDETKLTVRKPWAMRPLNMVVAANSSSMCTGFMSPETPANMRMSASVTVRLVSAVIPTCSSSKR